MSPFFLLWVAAAAQAGGTAPEWGYRIVAGYPHDITAFTEGLAMIDGNLLESTGLNGQSRLQIREIASGHVLKNISLISDEFGEGVTVAGDRIIQLTWTSGFGHVYDKELHVVSSFPLYGEGWGLTFDGHELIRSDGSSTLHYVSATNYADTRDLEVHDGAQPVEQLNELEWARGHIYANVWHSDRIAVIDPKSGRVLAWVDLATLKQQMKKPANWNEESVLNGIAYDPANGHFYVTGKDWPTLYEIAIDEPAAGTAESAKLR